MQINKTIADFRQSIEPRHKPTTYSLEPETLSYTLFNPNDGPGRYILVAYKKCKTDDTVYVFNGKKYTEKEMLKVSKLQSFA